MADSMDFGDILNQWDEIQKSEKQKQRLSGKNNGSRKRANAPTAQEKAMTAQKKTFSQLASEDFEKTINPMEMWLNRYGTVDKDALAEREANHNKFATRSNIVALRPDAHIDLHGLKREEAWEKLSKFVDDSDRRGYKKIMIIHGKGIHSHGSDPVLGEMVRRFIEQDKRLGTSGHPDASGGGKGATWVILKNHIFET